MDRPGYPPRRPLYAVALPWLVLQLTGAPWPGSVLALVAVPRCSCCWAAPHRPPVTGRSCSPQSGETGFGGHLSVLTLTGLVRSGCSMSSPFYSTAAPSSPRRDDSPRLVGLEGLRVECGDQGTAQLAMFVDPPWPDCSLLCWMRRPPPVQYQAASGSNSARA